MNASFLYFVVLLLAAAYFLRQMGRIAKAQEESAKHLYEIAWNIKTIAIHKAKADKAETESGKPKGAEAPSARA
jgi:hypothetical protein